MFPSLTLLLSLLVLPASVLALKCSPKDIQMLLGDFSEMCLAHFGDALILSSRYICISPYWWRKWKIITNSNQMQMQMQSQMQM